MPIWAYHVAAWQPRAGTGHRSPRDDDGIERARARRRWTIVQRSAARSPRQGARETVAVHDG